MRDHQKYVQSNLVTKNRSTHDSVFRCMQVASLLEEHLVGNYESLKDRTKYPETLCVTEDRQFRSRGLTHIEDWAYEFFLEAEVARVGLMNDYRLSQLRENLISESETHMKNDIHLQQKWLECFPEEEKEEKLVSYNFHCICFTDQN